MHEKLTVPEQAVDEIAGRGIGALHEALLHTLHDGVPLPGQQQQKPISAVGIDIGYYGQKRIVQKAST